MKILFPFITIIALFAGIVLSDACKFPKNWTNRNFKQFWVGTQQEIRDCFNNITLSQYTKKETLHVVRTIFKLYSYTDLVHNSPPPYQLNINIESILQQIENKVYSNDFDFHLDLAKLFTSLSDAHTVYFAPAGYRKFAVIRPFTFESRVDKHGNQHIYSAIGADLTSLYNHFSGITDVSYYYNRKILTIDGIDAMTFVKNYAATSGTYKDLSVRFNSVVSSTAPWQMSLFAIEGPGVPYHTYTFEDITLPAQLPNLGICLDDIQSIHDVTWLNRPAVTKKRSGELHYLDSFESDEKLMKDVYTELKQSKKRSKLNEENESTTSTTDINLQSNYKFGTEGVPMAIRLRNLEENWAKYLAETSYSSSDKQASTLLNHRSNDTLPKGNTYDLTIFSYSPEANVGYFSYKDTSVLKLASYSPDTDYIQTWLDIVASTIQDRSKHSLNKNLIIDVTGNGGGIICLNYWTLSFFVKDWSGARFDDTGASTIYEPYDLRHSVVTDKLVENGYLTGYPEEYVSPSTRQFLPNWYNGPTYQRGGLSSKYSTQAYWNLCTAKAKNFFDLLPKSSDWFDKIIIVTDGRCGSSCSYFVTKLRKDNKVRILSYGGLVGADADTSSFAGGNVEQYTNFLNLLTKQNLNTTDFHPLPTSAITSFNFREVYIPFAQNQTLPREWNKMVADWTINYWPSYASEGKQGLSDLYEATLPYFDQMPGGLPGTFDNKIIIILAAVFGGLLVALVILGIIIIIRRRKVTSDNNYTLMQN